MWLLPTAHSLSLSLSLFFLSLFLLSFCSWLPLVHGLTESSTSDVSPGFNYYDTDSQPFGYLANGSFEITVTNQVRLSWIEEEEVEE